GEIEAALLKHAQVKEAAVIAREDVPGEKRLVAYFTGGAAADAQSLREHLQTQLAEYMVPAAFVRLDALPLTANGKLDRRALPEPQGDAYGRREYEEPRGEIEQALAQIWQELLGVPRVGRHDHFFELGGHSLLAVQVAVRIRNRFQLHLPLRDLFSAPTIARLAAHTSHAATE